MERRLWGRLRVASIVAVALFGALGLLPAPHARASRVTVLVHAWLFGSRCPDTAHGPGGRARVPLTIAVGGRSRTIRVRCPGRRYEISGEPTAVARMAVSGDQDMVLTSGGRRLWSGRVGRRAGRFVLVELQEAGRALSARVFVRRRRPDYEQ